MLIRMSSILNKERFFDILTPPVQRIISIEEAICLFRQTHEDCIIGLTSGSFDFLHQGHLRYIHYLVEITHQKAVEQNKTPLVAVAINSDESTRANKGLRTTNRPIFDQVQRAELIAGLWGVNLTFIFNHDEQLELCLPHILLVSTVSDHPPDQRPEVKYLVSQGVKIFIQDTKFSDDSTTAILERIHENRIY